MTLNVLGQLFALIHQPDSRHCPSIIMLSVPASTRPDSSCGSTDGTYEIHTFDITQVATCSPNSDGSLSQPSEIGSDDPDTDTFAPRASGGGTQVILPLSGQNPTCFDTIAE
jgi:hypothetical protein